jgi:flagellar motor component MotA
MSVWCGIKTFSMSTLLDRETSGAEELGEEGLRVLDRITDLEEVGWFAAGFFTSVGMIGTVIGMIWALKGFIGVNVTDIASVQKLISDMVYGVSTALYTTLVGLVCSSLLKLQYFNLGHARRRVEP